MGFSEFFKEDTKNSMTRLVTFMLVVTAILLALLGGWMLIAGKVITELTYLIGVLLGFALGAKVTQKMVENKTEVGQEIK